MKTPAIPCVLFLLLLVCTPSATGEDSAPWFVNVSKDVGLSNVRAKDCIFTDLNGDGFHDLCLDRQRLYISSGGLQFAESRDHGLDLGWIRKVPLKKDGTPDFEKENSGPFVPQYLYFADLDNDGDQDAVSGVHSTWERFDGRQFVRVPECDHGARSTVWLNDGQARFIRARPSRFSDPDAAGPAMALALVDIDHDGNLDLYEGREYRQYGVLYGCGVDRLWKGNGKGGFFDITKAAGLLTVPEPARADSSRPSYGVTHADWNNDGFADLLQMAYGRQWNYLWKNLGNGKFTSVGIETGFSGDAITHGRYPNWVGRPPEQPFRSNGNTFDCAVGDYDNDGDLDLFLGEIQHAWAGEASDPPAILENLGEEGDWAFKRHPVQDFLPTREFRVADKRRINYGDLHAAWLDVDNDTRLDLLIGSGDYPDGQYLRLYHQQADGSFEEATIQAGFNWEGCGGLSIGDYDRDGDVDILAGRSFMRLNKAHREKFMNGIAVNEVGLFRNDIGNRSGNHWLNVRLVGRKANRSGIGARITVTAGGVTQIREIRAGSGLSNHEDPPEACFGLGGALKVDRLTVRWPDEHNTLQVFADLPADRFLEIDQSKEKPVVR